MDTAADAPAASTLDEQRPKGTPEHERSSFGPNSPEAPEPEEPEDEKNATAEAERPVRIANLPPPRPPNKPPTKSDRILPPLRFRRPPPIGMRTLRLK